MRRRIIKLTSIMRHDHPVTDARVYLLGDIVEGEIIFPHQPHQIDSSLFIQIKDGAEIVTNFLRQLLTSFQRVHVVAIAGNHGRLSESRRYHPESNADSFVYQMARGLLRDEKRLTWVVPSDWYAIDYPFYGHDKVPGLGTLPGQENHGFLIFHGHQIPGTANHSVATVGRHIYGWASGAVREPFDYAIYGHWHTSRRYRFNKYVAWCNGAVESSDPYAKRS